MTTHPPRTTHSQDGEGPSSEERELAEFAEVFHVLDAVQAPSLDQASLRRIRAGVEEGLIAGTNSCHVAVPASSPWQGFAWASAALTLMASAGFLAAVGVSTGGLLFAFSAAAILAGAAGHLSVVHGGGVLVTLVVAAAVAWVVVPVRDAARV